MNRVSTLLLLALVAASLTSCVVYPAPGPRPHAAGYWVPAHYGPYGGYYPGHWQ